MVSPEHAWARRRRPISAATLGGAAVRAGGRLRDARDDRRGAGKGRARPDAVPDASNSALKSSAIRGDRPGGTLRAGRHRGATRRPARRRRHRRDRPAPTTVRGLAGRAAAARAGGGVAPHRGGSTVLIEGVTPVETSNCGEIAQDRHAHERSCLVDRQLGECQHRCMAKPSTQRFSPRGAWLRGGSAADPGQRKHCGGNPGTDREQGDPVGCSSAD